MSQPNLIAFLRDYLVAHATGTALAGIAIDARRLEEGREPPVLLIEDAGAIRDRDVPMYRPYRASLTGFGRSPKEGADLYRAAIDILTDTGPFIVAGVGLWGAYDETGPQPRDDPDTFWPATYGVVGLQAADRVLA